ncbi:MAG: hypothetical protein JO099_00610 [Acidobacteriia bacterium]|nr:hypothetical protein [Terriglobia bacterium]
MGSQLFRVMALTIVSVGAVFSNEILNPGFEAGNFTDWTLSGETVCMGVVAAGSSFFTEGGTICGGLGSSIVHAGNYAAYLGPQNSDGSLSQSVATVPGATYDINFWLASLLLGLTNVPNDFSVTWGGQTLVSKTNVSVSPFTDFDYHATATGTSTTLTFTLRNDFSYFVLDDVSVTPVTSSVPEPRTMTTVAMIVIAGILGASWRKTRRASIMRT